MALTYYAIWPFFVCLAVLMLVASAPVFVDADVPPSGAGKRQSNLDGLRGFLAMAVFFQHGAIYHRFLAQAVWADPPRFYFVLGQAGVCLFFMITGYLFWGKLLADQGRPAWIRLYIGRIFRIGPVYLFAVAVVLAIVFCATGLHLTQPLGTVLRQIGAWLLIGMNGGGPDVNGYKGTGMLLFGVTWTLSSEWRFYASLLLWAVLARRTPYQLPVLAVAALACIVYSVIWPQPHLAAPAIRALMFLVGMICATLERRGLLLRLPRHVLSIAVAGFIAAPLTLADTVYAALPVLALAFAFYFIISGGDLFGVLRTRPARRMGDVSYSIYLLQGLVTTSLFTVPALRHFAVQSPLAHWASMCGCSVLLLLVSTVTYRFIERPGIALGKAAAGMRRPWFRKEGLLF